MPFGGTYHSNKKPIINIIIRNEGKDILQINEFRWELFICKEFLKEKDFINFKGKIELIEDYYGTMWKISGDNQTPLFIGQEIILLTLKIDQKLLIGELLGNQIPIFKVYYLLRTIDGNIPSFDKVTRDFMGIGIPVESYPQFREITFEDWSNVHNEIKIQDSKIST